MREERLNTLKTFMLLAGLTALVVMVGGALGGRTGIIIAFGFALAMNFGSYWFSDKIVLTMTRARPVEPGSAPELEGMIGRLSMSAGIPTPRLFVVDDPTPNAFATGRDPAHGVVAVNSGLLQMLHRDEVEGVVAHEIAHIKNRDILTSAVAATLAGAVSSIANMAMWAAMFGGMRSDDDEGGGGGIGALAMMILAPIAAMIIQMAVSRSREYAADAEGARISGKPAALASALANLERGVQSIPHQANPATAHMYIVSPLFGGGMASLFSTHPNTQERINRLMELDRQMGGAGALRTF